MRFIITTLLAIMLAFTFGCSSRSMVSPDANLEKYNAVTIYDSASASFIELELEQLFRELGYKIVGGKELLPGTTMGCRYSGGSELDPILGGTRFQLTILLEDVETDRTLTTTKTTDGNEQGVWKRAASELKRILPSRK